MMACCGNGDSNSVIRNELIDDISSSINLKWLQPLSSINEIENIRTTHTERKCKRSDTVIKTRLSKKVLFLYTSEPCKTNNYRTNAHYPRGAIALGKFDSQIYSALFSVDNMDCSITEVVSFSG